MDGIVGSMTRHVEYNDDRYLGATVRRCPRKCFQTPKDCSGPSGRILSGEYQDLKSKVFPEKATRPGWCFPCMLFDDDDAI